jgi:hypothetical protein
MKRSDGGVVDNLDNVLDFGGPLCSYCNADVHRKPDCPVKASQDEMAAKIRADREKWEKATYGIGGKIRRGYRRKVG